MLNIRDLTDQEGLFASKAKIKHLSQVIDTQIDELKSSLSQIIEDSSYIIGAFIRIDSRNAHLIKNFKVIQDEAKFSQLKISCMQDFFRAN